MELGYKYYMGVSCIFYSKVLKPLEMLFNEPTYRTVELFVGLSCASLPHFKPFLRRHLPKLLEISGHGSGNLSARRTKTSSRAAAGTLPLNDEDEVSLCRGGNELNGDIPLARFNSATKPSKTDCVSVTKDDQPVTVSIVAGKSISQGDDDSQRAILEAEAPEATSDINVEEYSHHNGY